MIVRTDGEMVCRQQEGAGEWPL